MTDDKPASSSYTEFFEKQRRGAETLEKTALVIVGVSGVAVVAIIAVLDSPYKVWIWAAVLAYIGYYGLQRLRKAGKATTLSLRHLEETSRFLHEPRRREEVVAYIASKKKPDASNVPEALYAYCSATKGNESVTATANAAFAQPASELAMAGFLRTALVLGGLFGTVLFFAFELARPGVLTGDFQELLPGLRGALASTLTGILGSVAIGVVASRSEQILERGMWETESFLAGPLSSALATEIEARKVQNETDLWQSLLNEVAGLRQSIEERHTALADDVAAHAVALQTVSDRLAELPPIVVPPQLMSLHESAAEFKRGMDTLRTTAETLVTVVQQVGVLAPVKTLEQLNAIGAAITAGSVDTSRQIKEVEAAVVRLKESVAEVPTSISTHTSKMEAELQAIRHKVTATSASAANLELAIGSSENTTVAADTTAIRRGIDALTSKVEELQEVAQRPSSEFPEGLDPDSPLSIEAVKAIVERSGRRLESALSGHLNSQVERLNAAVAKESTVRQAFGKLRLLDGIAAWHARAVKAPLMRLLLVGGKAEVQRAADKA